MRRIRTSRATVLAAALTALFLVGQIVAVSPVQADDPASPAAESREMVSLTRGEPLPAAGQAKPATAEEQILERAPGDAPAALTEPHDASPARNRPWAALMTETFEGTFPTGLWDVFDADGATNGEYFWDDDNFLPHNGSWSAWAANGGADGMDPEFFYYQNDMNSWMIYGPFDLSGYTAADMEFWYWNQSELNFDYFYWGASSDGTSFTGYQVSGDSGGWVYEDFDLASYLGDSSVWFTWVFWSDDSIWDDGPFVDDIALWGFNGGGGGPTNDDFDSPIMIGAAPYTNTQDITGATTAGDDPGFPCSSYSPKNRSVWYRYTAPSAQELTIDTIGSSYDTVLGVWTGSRGSLTNVACSDDAVGAQSRVQFTATPGTTYHIEVADYYNPSGTSSLTLNLTAGGGGSGSWTYMVYLDGDNNLESAGVSDFLEMSSVGSSANVDIVVQFDRIPGYSTSYDNWTDTRRFHVTTGMTPTAANGTSIGEANMGDPATLVSFVQWAMSTYPADHYALVLWDHGSGWRQRALDEPSVQGIAYDDTSGGDGLDMVDLRNALNTLTTGGASPFDLIGLDACLMAMIEVDGQMRPYADVRVTSQETEPGDGWPYDTILGALVANPAMTAANLGTIIVNNYYASYGNDQTQSATDLGTAYSNLNTAADNFAAALIANGAANAAGIQAARNAAQEFYFPYYIDLWDFAHRVQTNVTNTAIDNAAQAVKDAVDAAVIHEQSGSSWPGAHGISIYFPRTAGDYDARYDGSSGFLQFTANTQWDEWIHAYHGLGPGTVANDDFDSPIVIGSAPYTNTQDVAGATTAVDDPNFACGPLDQRYRTVWYRYTPPSAQTVTVDTLGSDYDTVLAVWTGSRGSLTSVGCSDDAVGLQSRVEFTAAAGTTYHIEAAAYGSSPSGSSLTLNLTTSGGGAGWTLLTPMSVGRSRPAVAATGGKVYVIGGESALSLVGGTARSTSSESDGAVLRAWETAVEEYNPGSNTWTTRAPKPTAASNIGAGVIGGIIYVPGGWDGGSGLTVHEAYNPATNTWSTKAPLPTAVVGGAVAAVGTKLYVLGGNDGAGTWFDTCYVYDQPTNTWSTCASMSTARSYAAAAVVDGKIYVAGGIDAGISDLNSVERYDPGTNTWATMSPMSAGRGGPGAVGYSGLVYVCGGGWSAYLTTCETYNPGTNSWSAFSPLNVGRRTLGMAEADGTLYAEAGWSGTYLGANEKRTVGAGTPPGAFGKTAPANGATGLGTSPSLLWGAAAGATSYSYCYDTTNNGSCDTGWMDTGTATSAALSGLSAGTTYYWQARAQNATGTTYADAGAWWSFTIAGTPPAAFGKTAPTNGATGVGTGPTLSWGTATGATSYSYCYDTTNNGACDTGWTDTGTATSAALSGLGAGTTYYWQARAQNATGTTYADGGTWWSFTTGGAAPGVFGKVSPANGAADQATDPWLTWSAASGVTYYEYCVDTVNNGVCDGSWMGAGAGTAVHLAGLAFDATYWWQVRAVNGFGTTYANAGAWWSFTTTSPTTLQMSFRSIGSQDGWILERDENSTKGSDVLDAAGTTARLGDNNTDYQYRSILAFDTSALPNNAVVTGITLYIKRQTIVGTNPFTIYNPGHKKGLNLLKVDMQAGYYHDDPTLERFDFHAIGSRGNVGRFIKTPAAGWWRAPLRAVSNPLLNLVGTTQFRLRFDLDDNDDMSADYVSFYTGNAAWGDRPELIVDYYIP